MNFTAMPEFNTVITETKPEEQNNIKQNIDNLNTEKNKKEWGNINLDPFAEANVVQTSIEDKKLDNNKENKSNKNEEEKAVSILNPFYSEVENPFANKIEESNNLGKEQKNENKVEEPIKDLDLENSKNPFEDLIENNTIVSQEKKEDTNNIIEKKDNNANEWGNINLDPFSQVNDMETVVKDTKQDIKVNNDDFDDGFNTASVVLQFSRGNDIQKTVDRPCN